MADYAIIITASRRYVPGLVASLNSMHALGMHVPVHVLYRDIPPRAVSAMKSAQWSFPFHIDDIETVWPREIAEHGDGDALMRLRYSLPSKLGVDAVCILDADMWVEQDLTPWLDLATTGYVFGCGHEQHKRYDDPNCRIPAQTGDYLIQTDTPFVNDLCCSPLFVGPQWYAALDRSARLFYDDGARAPDMDMLNVALIEAGAYPKFIPMPQQLWTGLHEAMLKAHSKACIRDGMFESSGFTKESTQASTRTMLVTDDGQQIKVVHGQWWNKKWREGVMGNMDRMIDREYDGSPSYMKRASDAMECICARYRDMATRGPVDLTDHFKDLRPESTDIMNINF